MAGRPKDPTINEKIFKEIDQLLETTYFRDMTIDQISENTGVSKATIYRRWKDKSSIIVDMFVSRIHVFENDYKTM
ncbi:TetR/AcrR family transcriptional regulator, partial [Staphylococcus hominis]|nr:TetR/AcrR family transcriptional regulator [Staphylococcus hominis]